MLPYNSFEALLSLSAIGLACLTLLLYGIYRLRHAQPDYQKIQQQGSSPFFEKELLILCYWAISPLDKICQKCAITPNQLTWSSLVSGGFCGLFIAKGFFAAAFWCATLAGIADVLDGMLARSIECQSPQGAVLDSSIDRYIDFFMLAGCCLYFSDNQYFLMISLAAIHGSFMISYTTAKAEAMQLTLPRGIMKRSERFGYLLVGLLLSALLNVFWQAKFPASLPYPLLVSVSIIALFANLSAVSRFWFIYQQATIQK